MKKNKSNRLINIIKSLDRPLLFAFLFMLIFGMLNIVTASSREAATWQYGIYHYFGQHLKMISLGLVAFFIALKMPTSKYNRLATIGWIIILGLIIYTIFYGESHRGSNRWINIEGFRFQPGEFAKPLVIVITAVLFERYQKLMIKRPKEAESLMRLIFVFGLGLAVAVFFQKDLGNAFIIGTIFLSLFILGPLSAKGKMLYLGLVGLVLLIISTILFWGGGGILEQYQINRFDFLDPCSKYERRGYQICNGYIAINEGGLFGVGIGNSRQKYSYIDEPHTDMVFSIIVEEYGVIIAGGLLLVYTAIMIRFLAIAKNAKKTRLRYIAFGIFVYTFLQILINLGGLFGLIPFTGVILPFLSYGGSFTIAYLATFGIAFRLCYENRQEKIKLKKA